MAGQGTSPGDLPVRPPLGRDDADRLRVLDLGTFVAGPFVASILGDLGAEVIKIERPHGGDTIRAIGPGTARDSYLWYIEGRNKRSITLNMATERGRELFLRLAGWADVLVENLRPGTMRGWGLDYDALHDRFPELVYVGVSAFGGTGPMKDLPGVDRVGTAFGGMTYVTGFSDGPPVRPGYAVADYMTGMFGAIGALEAVRRRDRAGGGGGGEYVDVALYESLLRISEFTVPHYLRDGVVRERNGNASPSSAPSGVHRTSDGHWVTVAAPSAQLFERLFTLMGREDLRDDPRCRTSEGRALIAEELDGAVGEWVGQRSRAQAERILGEAGIPVSGINSIRDIVVEPQVEARGNVVRVPTPEGEMPMQGVVPRLTVKPGTIRWAGEPLGASNEDVYCGLLGLTQAELDDLRGDRVI